MKRAISGRVPRIRARGLARATGAVAGAVVALLAAVFAGANPYGGPVTDAGSGLVMAWIGWWGLIAVVAAMTERPGTLIACFVLSFFLPWGIGIYLLGTPGIFKWIPVAQIGYVVAAVSLLLLEPDEVHE